MLDILSRMHIVGADAINANKPVPADLNMHVGYYRLALWLGLWCLRQLWERNIGRGDVGDGFQIIILISAYKTNDIDQLQRNQGYPKIRT